MFFHSIRFRLTFWYALTLAVILAASGLFWHIYLSRNLLENLDERLLIVAQDVAAFHLCANEEAIPPGGVCKDLEDFASAHDVTEYVQILNEERKLICLTCNLRQFHLPFSKEAQDKTTRGEPLFESIRTPEPRPIRMVTLPVLKDRHVTHFVQVGASTSSMEEALRELRLILLTFTPAGLLIISLGGCFLASRALAPVVNITREVNKIKAENLDQRLPVGKASDEISQLAETFNSMLSRLEDSFRKIKQFSGDASHELRTPLTILKGETEVTLRWAKEPEEFRKMLESNLEEIDRMERIIEDLLALAKSEAGEMPLVLTKFSLSDLLQDLYLQGKTLGEAKKLSIVLRPLVNEEISILGDQLRIHQVFLNLISNAVKYTTEEKEVVITLSIQDDYAVVAIADQGIGIAEEHIPYIFDRFYRVDGARNRAAGGTGLGLSIVKWIVTAHDGKIDVKSEPGKGSVFTVYLPINGPTLAREKIQS